MVSRAGLIVSRLMFAQEQSRFPGECIVSTRITSIVLFPPRCQANLKLIACRADASGFKLCLCRRAGGEGGGGLRCSDVSGVYTCQSP